MIITEKGTYKALQDITTRGSFKVGTIPAGTEFIISQIDSGGHKVIGNIFFDWIYWDLPVEKVD